MDSLRWTLLALGIVAILGIYFWDVFKNKLKPKRRSEVIFNQDSSLGFRVKPNEEEEAMDYAEAISDLNKVRASLDEQLEESAALDEQLESKEEFNDTDDVTIEAENGQGDTNEEKPDDDFVILRIVAKEDKEFRGLKILIATKQVEMKFGHMNIFHHYGVGELHSDQSIFSLANMFEPGEFNLQEMEAFSTKGLVVYMPLPSPLSASMSFELMLNTSQRIAEQLEGELRTMRNQPLDETEIQSIRDKIRQYE